MCPSSDLSIPSPVQEDYESTIASSTKSPDYSPSQHWSGQGDVSAPKFYKWNFLEEIFYFLLFYVLLL